MQREYATPEVSSPFTAIISLAENLLLCSLQPLTLRDTCAAELHSARIYYTRQAGVTVKGKADDVHEVSVVHPLTESHKRAIIAQANE